MGVRQYAFIIVVGLPAIGFLVAYPLTKTTNITIGKETTIITKPLADDGYPDYLTALNQNGSEAVTSDRNAAVHFCRALGSNWLPAAERRAYFEMLGINPPPEQGNYLVSLEEYIKERHADRDKAGLRDRITRLQDQLDKAQQQPWSATDHPILAAWIAVNEIPLNVVSDGTLRPHFFSPLISGNGVSSALLMLEQEMRKVAIMLRARAYLQIERGSISEAWQDILTCYRLSRLIGQGPFLVHSASATTLNRNASRTAHALMKHCDVAPEQIKAFSTDISTLPSIVSAAKKVDLAERYSVLDQLIRHVAHGGSTASERGFLSGLQGRWNQRIIATSFDWDEILRAENAFLDRLVQHLHISSVRAQKAAIEGEFERVWKVTRSYDSNGPRSVLLEIADKHSDSAKRTSEAVHALASYLMPAVSAQQFETDIRVQMDITKIVFALAIFQLENGHYPLDLDQLDPGQLKDVPLDEYTEEPFRYRRLANGYRLVTYGPDGKDDQGENDDILVHSREE